ncbi:MAG: sulfatase [Bacteroidetes bacterium]|nr:MAG: sulfatase [Bacteroidota bacterium]
MHKLLLFFVCLCLTLLGCKQEADVVITDPAANPPNILLIIADDLGKDAIAGFAEGTIKPTTPHIDALRNAGLLFSNVWVYPTCSPTRASIITGKYGYRTGVKWAGDALNSTENILPNYLQSATSNRYATAVVGKWHLAGEGISNFNPETLGIDYYAGLLSGAAQSYTQWQLSENGTNTSQNTYITEKFTDLAINWVAAQEKPWFLWLAYTAPHTPFHTPPANMHTQGNLPDYTTGMDPTPYYMAAIEAMDFQIGRLLESLPAEERANTTIIFIGDNGTPNQVAQAPYTSTTVKGSLFQGGINTPMFVAGAQVARVGTEASLITGTDLFATIAELAGVDLPEIYDSKSFKSLLTAAPATPLRDFQYSEKDDGTANSWTIRSAQYKLIVNANGNNNFYDLNADPYERVDLLAGTLSGAQMEAKAVLEAELDRIRN